MGHLQQLSLLSLKDIAYMVSSIIELLFGGVKLSKLLKKVVMKDIVLLLTFYSLFSF